MKNSSEHLEQSALFQWAKLNEKKYPALCNLFAVPNGGKLPYTRIGKGKIWSGQRFKLVKEGLKKGVPDIFLAWPAGKKHGLFIEMKYGKNKVSPEQEEWIDRLDKAGYTVFVCYGFEEARDCIIDYINGYYL